VKALQRRLRLSLIGLGLLGLLLAGCATQRIDWASRIGSYSYDQAVVDLGPPDKYAKLSEGTAVADWLVQRGYVHTYAPFGYGCYPWYPGAFYPPYAATSSPDYFLRLTFGTDGRLKEWKNFYK
jgi:hypothetical protein